jgi:hypothetical protein
MASWSWGDHLICYSILVISSLNIIFQGIPNKMGRKNFLSSSIECVFVPQKWIKKLNWARDPSRKSGLWGIAQRVEPSLDKSPCARSCKPNPAPACSVPPLAEFDTAITAIIACMTLLFADLFCSLHVLARDAYVLFNGRQSLRMARATKKTPVKLWSLGGWRKTGSYSFCVSTYYWGGIKI